jgi:hypothetical protein
MCTELLPPGGYPTAVNKIYHIINNKCEIGHTVIFFLSTYERRCETLDYDPDDSVLNKDIIYK